MSEPGTSREIEAKMIFVGAEGRGAFEEAARAHDRDLTASPDAAPSSSPLRRLELRDRYFDLEGDLLRERDSGLRLRDAGGPTLLTFKGPADVRIPGVVDRLELEGEWSQGMLVRILDHLAALGVHLPAAVPCDEPVETLARLGFRLVHSRRTVRREAPLREAAPGLRQLLLGDEATECPNVVVALDEVHYETAAGRVVHREVEYEASDDHAVASLSKLHADHFGRRLGQIDRERRELGFAEMHTFLFSGPIRPWKWSKTALGAELQRLEQEGRLAALVEGEALTSEAYVEIAGRLRRAATMGRLRERERRRKR